MQIIRTRFKKDIVAEISVPSRPTSGRVIILASGVPSSPSKTSLLEFLANEGFWAISFRYRGSWESGGVFLKKSPHEDILDIVDGLSRPLTDVWTKKKFKIGAREIFVIGSSFGGAGALLASCDKRIKKIVALSPVVDWRIKSKEEPLPEFYRIIKEGYSMGYRFTKKEFSKLESGKFYNPMLCADKINGVKLFIICAKDDGVVSYKPVERFAKTVGAKFKLYKYGGHFGAGILLKKPTLWRQILRFIDSV